jgi:hypothetical protein
MWAERVTAGINAHTDPRERILAVYNVLGALFAQPDYRGCAFMNATAEAAPDSVGVPLILSEAARLRAGV